MGPVLPALTGSDYTVFVVADLGGTGERWLLRAHTGGWVGIFMSSLVDGTRASFTHATAIDKQEEQIIVGLPETDASLLVAKRRGGLEAPLVELSGSNDVGLDACYASSTNATEDFGEDVHLLFGSAYEGIEGRVGEILIYSRALADVEVDETRQYLADKWGM